MARHWSPLKDPTGRETRSRSIIRPLQGVGAAQWGQRPLFSEPGPDQSPPEDGRMPSEVQPDVVHPEDGRLSAEGVAVAVALEARIPVHMSVTNTNVSNPPTDAQLRAVLGQRKPGDTFLISDGGGGFPMWLVARGPGDKWHYSALTEAV